MHLLDDKLHPLRKILDYVNPKLGKVFLPWLIKHPKYLKNSSSMMKRFQDSEKTRQVLLSENLTVPPVMILSITEKCNLFCSGCFSRAVGNTESLVKEEEKYLSKTKWEEIISEAVSLGVFCFLLAGGEPFLFPGLLDICKKFSKNLFLIFSNGISIGEKDLRLLKELGNVIILISLEGNEEMTDSRRGKGVYQKACNILEKLDKRGILSGASVTISRINFSYWMKEENLDFLLEKGIKVCFFTELIPVSEKEKVLKEMLILSTEERKLFREKVLYYKSNKPLFIIHSPGDEEIFGGCVSAGRGFAHITPTGDLTPCPISDIASHNLRQVKLKEALKCDLFTEIRENGEILENTEGPCALFEHQSELENIRKKTGAYRINRDDC